MSSVRHKFSVTHFEGDSRCRYFIDFEYSLNRDYTLGVCRVPFPFREHRHWYCRTRADYVDVEPFAGMNEAGCLRIHFGVEPGSE